MVRSLEHTTYAFIGRLTGCEWYHHASVSSKNDFVASIILQLVFVRFYIYRIFRCTLMWMFLVLAVDVTTISKPKQAALRLYLRSCLWPNWYVLQHLNKHELISIAKGLVSVSYSFIGVAHHRSTDHRLHFHSAWIVMT